MYYIYKFDILVCVCLQNLLFYSPHTYTEHNCGGYLGSHCVNVTHSTRQLLSSYTWCLVKIVFLNYCVDLVVDRVKLPMRWSCQV
jgi:hypothetical protein